MRLIRIKRKISPYLGCTQTLKNAQCARDSCSPFNYNIYDHHTWKFKYFAFVIYCSFIPRKLRCPAFTKPTSVMSKVVTSSIC